MANFHASISSFFCTVCGAGGRAASNLTYYSFLAGTTASRAPSGVYLAYGTGVFKDQLHHFISSVFNLLLVVGKYLHALVILLYLVPKQI